jgi:origin recognition complex subunit 2
VVVSIAVSGATLYLTRVTHGTLTCRSGFNLLFYGLGSKKQLLEDFAKIYCKDNPLIVVNGYFPNLTVKAILNALVTKVLNVSDASVNAQFKSVHEQVEYLQHIWAKHEEIRSPRVKHRLHKNAKLYHDVPDRIYLLLHNIDAPALRTPRAQEHLSLLAHIPQLHLLASTDHLNAALLWDNRQLDRFNWLWLHVPSYARLNSETSYEGQISDQFAARRPGGRRGALQVLQTLPAKAKQIFLVLARSQLADPQSRGLEFEQYLAQCQEQFLTSTSTVFKATLGEFVDHQLIQMKRAADGALYCNTPLHLSTLKQILEEIDQEQ